MFLCAFAKVFLLWVSTLGEAKAPVPPTVEPGAKDFGGGTSDTPGHGAWMQEVGHSKPVEVLTGLPDWQTFYQDYVRANRPVVLKNAAQTQKAFSKWTDEYLLDLWRKRRVDVEIKKVEERGGPTVQWPFEKFLREMYKVERKDELYAVIGFEDDAQALADVALPQPARCQEVWPQSATLWMSNGGTMSVLHNDDGENFLMLLDGTKSVMLVHQDDAPNIYAHIAKVRGTSPVRQDFVDLVMFPRFGNITWLHGEIGPGDILFIPHTYWHQVNSKGRNLALNIWWSHEADWRWWDLNQYDATQFGTSKLPSFNEFKSKASKSVKCTPLPSHQTLAEGKLVDEGHTKEIIRKKRAKAAKRQNKGGHQEL